MITPDEAVEALLSANPALVVATFDALDGETQMRLRSTLTILAGDRGAEQ